VKFSREKALIYCGKGKEILFPAKKKWEINRYKFEQKFPKIKSQSNKGAIRKNVARFAAFCAHRSQDTSHLIIFPCHHSAVMVAIAMDKMCGRGSG
jgi:hypothetical protein